MVIKHEKSCEDRCIVAYVVNDRLGSNFGKMVEDGDIISSNGAVLHLFNYCPYCGQELECDVLQHANNPAVSVCRKN